MKLLFRIILTLALLIGLCLPALPALSSDNYPVASMRYFKLGSSGYELTKESFVRRYPASKTKLLTALVAYDAAAKKGTLDQTFTLTYSMLSVPAGSSSASFRSGDKVTDAPTLERDAHPVRQ